MKVKVLSNNLMVDYKKAEKGATIDISESVANRFITAGLVQQLEDKPKPTALIVKIEDKEVDINKFSVDDLKAFVVANELGIEQLDKELKAEFAKRVYDAAIAKLGE